jgi:hypothetical protein
MRTSVNAATLALVVAAGLTSGARATMLTWNFSNPAGAVNSPHAYADTSSAFNITAAGFTTTITSPSGAAPGQTWGPGGSYNFNAGTIASHRLFGKVSSPDETGLGLDGLDDDHEIQGRSFVQLDLANLLANHFSGMTMIISSVQLHEGYSVWGSNASAVPGALLAYGGNAATGGDVQSFAVPQFGTYRYVSISANGGDVLLANGLTASVPAPGAAVLLGLLGCVSRRRRR